MITITTYRQGHFEQYTDPQQLATCLAESDALVWVDVSPVDAAAIDILRTHFHFHPLALEDVERPHQRPKIDAYSDYYFIVVYAVNLGPDDDGLNLRELDIFVGANFVVTVHQASVNEISQVAERWQRSTASVGTTVGALLYAVLDAVVDGYFPVIDEISERVDAYEDRIFERFDSDVLDEIFYLKKELLTFRRVVAPTREALNVLLRRDPPIVSLFSLAYFNDIYDHTVRVLDGIDMLRDQLSNGLEAYLSVQGNNLNEVMRRLTVISTIFLPLTFLTGFFGMNWVDLPFQNTIAMGLSILAMVAVPVGMYLWFRRQGLS